MCLWKTDTLGGNKTPKCLFFSNGHSQDLKVINWFWSQLFEDNCFISGVYMPYIMSSLSFNVEMPPWGPGGLSRECAPPYPQRDRKRRLNGAVCRNHRIKRLVPCRCWDWHVKEPYEMSMAWEPDRRSNSFFSPPAHLCAVTYMTEIPLIVTLNNHSLTHSLKVEMVWSHAKVLTLHLFCEIYMHCRSHNCCIEDFRAWRTI